MVALSSCDDYLEEETRKNEYTIWYNVTYSTTYDFHNIAYISFTSFFDSESLKTLVVRRNYYDKLMERKSISERIVFPKAHMLSYQLMWM